MAWSYERCELWDATLFRTSDFDCSSSGSRSVHLRFVPGHAAIFVQERSVGTLSAGHAWVPIGRSRAKPASLPHVDFSPQQLRFRSAGPRLPFADAAASAPCHLGAPVAPSDGGRFPTGAPQGRIQDVAIENRKVFISWSGERSRKVAEALRDWLPDILPLVDAFLSAEDIEKGAKWRQVISSALNTADMAIICLTPDNLDSPWLLFEAGAVAKHDESRVWTYLFGLSPTDVKDPLSEFQHTVATKDDTKRLLMALNGRLTDGKLSHERLIRACGIWWPQLEASLDRIPKQAPRPGGPKDPIEHIVEITTEILQRVRESTRQATIDASELYDDNDRVDMASIISTVLVQRLRREGIPFKAVGTCTDGGYGIFQDDKGWRIEKRVAEDLALGRISLSEMFAASTQDKNPCRAQRTRNANEPDEVPKTSP